MIMIIVTIDMKYIYSYCPKTDCASFLFFKLHGGSTANPKGVVSCPNRS